MNDPYRIGNLKLLEMMISQINEIIENTQRGDKRTFAIDEDKINKKLCSTNKLAYLLETGAGIDRLPNNDEIYSMDFFESINNYIDTKYQYEFYNIYTLMEMYGDLQRVYDEYNKHGYLPWDNKKKEEQIDASNLKNNKRRPRLEDFDPVVMVYNGEYHVGSPCSYSYEYLQYVQPTSRYHTGTFIYKITRVDPRVDTPYDKRVISRVVGINTDIHYLLMITNTEKFWDKYVEPRIQELEETKANFIKYQEEKENEGTN